MDARQLFFLVFFGLLNLRVLHAQPTSNPVRDFYPDLPPYHWTDTLPWQKVYNIQDYAGATYDEQFQKARDAAHQAGGGVVYFPAGTYTFNESLQLEPGVILRGDPPVVDSAIKIVSHPLHVWYFQNMYPT